MVDSCLVGREPKQADSWSEWIRGWRKPQGFTGGKGKGEAEDSGAQDLGRYVAITVIEVPSPWKVQ